MINKNISIWRGNATPPTNYHLWEKEDGGLYVYLDEKWQHLVTPADKIILDEHQQQLDKIKNLALTEIDPIDTNTYKSYQLKSDDNIFGTTINIPKDRFIKQVTLGYDNATIDESTGIITIGTGLSKEYLLFSVALQSGSYELVSINLTNFLTEKDYSDGLEVVDNNLKVKVDPSSEEYLKVTNAGIKVEGVDTNFNKINERLTTISNTQIKRSEMGVANGVATLDNNGTIPYNQLPTIADDEDLIEVNNRLKLKDRVYDPDNFSGKGYVILRKNIINDKNILTQDMINEPNTVYEIRYNFDLDGEDIQIKDGCVLNFVGGSLKNGTLIGNNTELNSKTTQIFNGSLLIKGIWNLQKVYPEWFGAKGDGVTDDTLALKAMFNFSADIYILHETYKTEHPIILLNRENVTVTGGGTIKYVKPIFSTESTCALGFIKCKRINVNNITIDKTVLDKSTIVENVYRDYCIYVLTKEYDNDPNTIDTEYVNINNCVFIDNVGIPSTNSNSYYGSLLIGDYGSKCRNIRVNNNTFEHPTGRILYLTECEDFEICNNSINNVNYFEEPPLKPTGAFTMAIRVLSSKRGKILNNKIIFNNSEGYNNGINYAFYINQNDKEYKPSKDILVSNNITESINGSYQFAGLAGCVNVLYVNNVITISGTDNNKDILLSVKPNISDTPINTSFINNVINKATGECIYCHDKLKEGSSVSILNNIFNTDSKIRTIYIGARNNFTVYGNKQHVKNGTFLNLLFFGKDDTTNRSSEDTSNLQNWFYADEWKSVNYGSYYGTTAWVLNLGAIWWNGTKWVSYDNEDAGIKRYGVFSEKPTPSYRGFQYFNTDTHKMITWDGSKWWNSDGTDLDTSTNEWITIE